MTHLFQQLYHPKSRSLSVSLAIIIALASASAAKGADEDKSVAKPLLVGNWWRIADNPIWRFVLDQPTASGLGVWQANDGSCKLWVCIRHTKEAGYTRLFIAGKDKPHQHGLATKGITMRAELKFGEKNWRLQAPFVFAIKVNL